MCSLAVRTSDSNCSFVRFDRSVTGAPGRRLAARQAALELRFQELDARARELIQRLEVVVGRDARVGDEEQPVLGVVEREHRVEQHEGRQVGGGVGPFERPARRGTGSNHSAAS